MNTSSLRRPGFCESSSTIRANSAFFCSMVRVLLTVIWRMHEIVGPRDVHVGLAELEFAFGVLGNGDEAIFVGHGERFPQGLVDAIADRPLVVVGFPRRNETRTAASYTIMFGLPHTRKLCSPEDVC